MQPISTSPSGQICAEVLRLTATLPAGRLTTFGALGNQLKASPRHIATLLAAIAEDAETDIPWHRVVADGGAVGRHERRGEQIRRLQAEGIAVSTGGFVQDFVRVAVLDLSGPMPSASPSPQPGAATLLGRSRGMKDRPR